MKEKNNSNVERSYYRDENDVLFHDTGKTVFKITAHYIDANANDACTLKDRIKKLIISEHYF
ncbi:MAG: hypothetical protein K5768_08825 [Firmicutes bacterium]|nr:hypothetical protein [Bacillota bacterium]